VDFQDVSIVDGVLEDVRARFDQVEIVILDLAFSALLGGHGEPAPDLISKLVVELASSGLPFFKLPCFIERLDEKLFLILGGQPLPESL
jgi:hypothetical protein